MHIKKFHGNLIDSLARKSLQNAGLDYAHGTGHGVGFLNVHEYQAISKYNKVKIKRNDISTNLIHFKINMESDRELNYADGAKNNLFLKI